MAGNQFGAEFWQLFLSAGLRRDKSRAFFEELGAFLVGAGGSGVDAASVLRSWPHLDLAERRRIERVDLSRLRKALDMGVEVLEGRDFPERLAEVASPPEALFVWGNLECLDAPSVAIVGTRNATSYGLAIAQKFGEELSKAGVVVVSGGALGIDAAAHKGVLAAEGQTVAVLPGGIDQAYPARHHEMYREIREKGGILVSQFPVGTSSYKQNFLLRNQIVAALADAVLIIEAPYRSGALSTASAAADMGRDVYVVPGNIALDNYRGSHALIRDGAVLVDHPDQVLEGIGHAVAQVLPVAPAQLTVRQREILETLDSMPVLPEVIMKKLDIGPSELLMELTVLEMEALVIKTNGGYSIKP